jgi:hypothetical protein
LWTASQAAASFPWAGGSGGAGGGGAGRQLGSSGKNEPNAFLPQNDPIQGKVLGSMHKVGLRREHLKGDRQHLSPHRSVGTAQGNRQPGPTNLSVSVGESSKERFAPRVKKNILDEILDQGLVSAAQKKMTDGDWRSR